MRIILSAFLVLNTALQKAKQDGRTSASECLK